jgi:dihydrodipicolinate synthase/N-acetylneuraminate lyase
MQSIRDTLSSGIVIPACPLALDAQRRWDERRQRALLRYYLDAGAGGLAVAVHTTQFAIREPRYNLFQPLLRLVRDEMQQFVERTGKPIVRIAGICGRTAQAVQEAEFIRETGFHAGLLNLSAMTEANIDQLVDHCRRVAEIVPVFGFYLSTSVGGRELPFAFWRRFAEIENVLAIKIAAFNRYQTVDVVRAVVEAGRDDIALYTGNDDNIIADLITPFRFLRNGEPVERRIVGGLLGQWAVGTRAAVELLEECHRVAAGDGDPLDAMRMNVELTDFNAVMFDASHGFAGCVPGVHEVLRRQGLLDGIWCLDPSETLSLGQSDEITRVMRAYPWVLDERVTHDS